MVENDNSDHDKLINGLFYLVCAAMHHPCNGQRLYLQETYQVVLIMYYNHISYCYI